MDTVINSQHFGTVSKPKSLFDFQTECKPNVFQVPKGKVHSPLHSSRSDKV